jgi:cold shock CspA family protein
MNGVNTVTSGEITKVVRTHGSAWGKIRPQGATRNVFFNLASLVRKADFENLEAGQEVEFEEVSDQVNGSHAVNLTPSPTLQSA